MRNSDSHRTDDERHRKGVEPSGTALEVCVDRHTGPRADLRSLFELAEDSSPQLDAYIDAGRVLVALQGEQIIGHLQLTETGRPEEVEIKNIAVLPSHQRRGVGRALIAAAIALVRDEARSALTVATAAADTGNLRFYQRLGFRMSSIERDAFTESTGYDPELRIDGIELRDRVWLCLPIDAELTRRIGPVLLTDP
jgi:ribosomal protein S18 acetylase RimI-like enzyme